MPSVSQFSRPASRPRLGGQWITSEELRAFEAAGTNAHRLYSAPGCWVERFGPDVLVSYQDAASRDETVAALQAWSATQQCKVRRIFGRFLPRQNPERAAPVLLHGDPSALLTTEVSENGMRFGIDFAAGYSPGLFIDQRANRAFLRRTPLRHLLNTFSYTCSFSVAAALNGAQTTSIDLSQKSLNRGRANFALNSLDPADHHFEAGDVLDALPRLARKGARFDGIILDPPTFSRGHKGRRFQVARDFEELIVGALELAAPGGKLLLSTNCARLTRGALEAVARFALKASRRSATFHREPALPDVPMEFAAQTLWLLLKN